MELKILKSFSLALALSTWIRHLDMVLVDLIFLSVNLSLFKRGGILMDKPYDKMSWSKKPLSARIMSSIVNCLSKPDRWTMAFGATPTMTLKESIAIYGEYVAHCWLVKLGAATSLSVQSMTMRHELNF